MELKLYLRQPKRLNQAGADIHLSGNNPKSLSIQPGQLPQSRRLPMYNKFVDVTEYVSDLFKLKFTWTHERDQQGVSVAGSFNQKKAASGTITFEGEAYKYLKEWLINDESGSLNSFDVEVHHVNVGIYGDWSIKSTDLTWCEGEICTFDVTLKQRDEALSCIKSTMIADNWQGWFGDDTETPWSGKKHPRFSYCNEIRPNGMLITIWFLITQLMGVLIPFMILLATIINPIIIVIKGIVKIINAIVRFINNIGGKLEEIDEDKFKTIEPKDIKDIFGHFFIESAGCGREHPAPLIRDYISNVCSKCNVTVTPDTAPIFFNRNILLESADSRRQGLGVQTRHNPHYNACYLSATVDRGIRRYDKLNIFKGTVENNTSWWLPGNKPLLTLDMFLDELKGLYNAEWRVVNNTLYFKRKDFWIDEKYKFDFGAHGADRNLLIQGLCFEWDEVKSPVSCKGIYTSDGADVCGNEAQSYMDGAVSYGLTDINPNLEGMQDKTVPFGATKFRLDGASTDYVLDAMQQVINTTLITGSIWTTAMFNTVNGFFEKYADYALLLKQETVTLPKVLIWNEQTFEGLPKNAKCIVPFHGYPGTGTAIPGANLRYNNNPTQQWHERHPAKSRVSGGKMIPNSYTDGYYTVKGIWGTKVAEAPVKLVNYPMYFEPFYVNTLWDWFHWIDDPEFNPTLHQKFTAHLELCKDTLLRIEPFGNGSNIVLGQRVKLPAKFQDAYITEITVDYNTDEEKGQNIEIKGKV